MTVLPSLITSSAISAVASASDRPRSSASDCARQFATSNQIQIMVINIQSFQKDVADKDLSEMTDEELKALWLHFQSVPAIEAAASQ